MTGDLRLGGGRQGEFLARQLVGKRRRLTYVDGRLILLREQRLVNVLVRARVVSLIVDHSDHLLESGDETVGSIRVQVGDTHLQQVFVDRVDREPLGL